MNAILLIFSVQIKGDDKKLIRLHNIDLEFSICPAQILMDILYQKTGCKCKFEIFKDQKFPTHNTNF